jgi:alpha-amylase
MLTPCVLPALLAAAACTANASQPRPPRRFLQPIVQWNRAWSRGAVFYEIFVRSFEDSNGDGIGDLPGLIAKLDYLNDGDPTTTLDLGVNAIWLMPIFESPSYHGYDVTDYELVDPDYGTNQDFATLVLEAHRRGIRIILDLVINHTSSQHPWFESAGASLLSPRRDWYVWRHDDPGWTQPWGGISPTWHRNAVDGWYYYGIFSAVMPDLNYRNPPVLAEVEQVARQWLSAGADGYRLDAARYLVANGPGPLQQDQPQTHQVWKELAAYVRALKPDAVLVGEVWADTAVIATYYGSNAVIRGGDELPINFDFPLADAIIDGVNAGDAGGIARVLAGVHALYPTGADDAPFLSNHDMIRVATRLGNSQPKLRNTAAILLTLPGTLFIYYGEELGMQNGAGGSDDHLKRTPMPWNDGPGGGFTTGTPWYPFAPGRDTANVADETDDPASLLSRYRDLIRMRASSQALTAGDLVTLTPTGAFSPVLAFLRAIDGEIVLAVHNLSDAFVAAGPLAVPGLPGEALFKDSGVTPPSGPPGAWRITLPARASGVWRVLADR